MEQLPNYERPTTPPPGGAGPSLSHRAGQEWDRPTIVRVKQMKEDGKSASEIKKRTLVPPRTQRKIITEHQDSDRRPGRTSNRGRPPKIDIDTVYKMEKSIQGRYRKRTLSWDSLGKDVGAKATYGTVKRRMNSQGYRKCRACKKKWLSEPNIEQRYDVSEEWRNLAFWQWKGWHFSDEFHMEHNARNTEWVIRLPSKSEELRSVESIN